MHGIPSKSRACAFFQTPWQGTITYGVRLVTGSDTERVELNGREYVLRLNNPQWVQVDSELKTTDTGQVRRERTRKNKGRK